MARIGEPLEATHDSYYVSLYSKQPGLGPSLLVRATAEPVVRFDALPTGSFVVALEEALRDGAKSRKRLIVGGKEIEAKASGRYQTIASVATQLETAQQVEVQLEFVANSPPLSDIVLTVDCTQRAAPADEVKVRVTPLLHHGPDQGKVDLELVAATEGGLTFVADGLRTGTYRTDVRTGGGAEVLWAVSIALVPGQNEFLIELPPTVVQTIRVQDSETGLQIDPEALFLRLAESRQSAGHEAFRFVRMITPDQMETGTELAEGPYEVVVAASGYGWQNQTVSVLGESSEVVIELETAAEIEIAKPSPEGNVFNADWIESFSVSDSLGRPLDIVGYSPIAIRSGEGPVSVAGFSLVHDGNCVVEVPALAGVCDEQTISVTLRRGETTQLPVSWSN